MGDGVEDLLAQGVLAHGLFAGALDEFPNFGRHLGRRRSGVGGELGMG